ncbi:MAG: RidA family protein [Acidimicrobiia bacterium]
MHIESRLADLAIDLPQAAAPMANYVPYTISGNLLFISGQTPTRDGQIVGGTVGVDTSIEEAVDAARISGLLVLAQVHAACGGDWTRVRRCLKLGGFVASGADFTDHPMVINGASNLMVDVFGDAGRHARFAVGAPALPGGAVVEVEAVFELEAE